MKTIPLFALIAFLLIGCTITQTVNPVSQVATNQVCIIEDPEVRPGFLVELKTSLQLKNADVRVLDPDAKTTDCPLVLEYTARWSWDITIYMSYAEINVFQDGQTSGQALYDATKGSGRTDKFIDAEPKIRELVNELFPDDFPASQGQRSLVSPSATSVADDDESE